MKKREEKKSESKGERRPFIDIFTGFAGNKKSDCCLGAGPADAHVKGLFEVICMLVAVLPDANYFCWGVAWPVSPLP